MPRPFVCRRVWFRPGITYFKPAGARLTGLVEVVLTVDEFEAVRLKDFLGIGQEEAAKKMNVSQPTFSRILESARKKIADALVNGKAIRIEGGTYKMAGPIVRGRGRGFGGPAMICMCPSCGHQEAKQRGVPCSTLRCPKCGAPMVRGQ